MKKPLTEKEEKEFLIKLGKRLKQVRQAKGYSNYESFAYEKGLSRSNYGKYEKGANLQMNTFAQILKGLDISLEEFFSEGFD